MNPATIAILDYLAKPPFCDPQSACKKSSAIDRCSIHVIDNYHSSQRAQAARKSNYGRLGSQSAKTVSRYLVDLFVVAGCI
jgi:hypothetical protein